MLSLMLMMAVGFGVNAQTEEKPAITFHTTIYDTNGAENDFSLLIGATEAGVGQYIDVDCGFGTQEVLLSQGNYDKDSDSSSGSFVSCRVSSEGIVKIYCENPAWIDWLNFSGCYIDKIDLGDLTELIYLDLSHNELKSLDLSKYTKIQALYLTDNAFDESPVVIGPKPGLTILELNSVGHVSSDFTLRDYPYLYSFDAWACGSLTEIDASNCPEIVKISIDGTSVSKIDVSKNEALTILNVSDTRITELDLSNNPNLVQLYCTHEADINSDCKITKLDLTHNPNLYYLFCTGNDLTELDLSKCPNLGSLTARKNLLTSIDLSNNPYLYCVNISDNYLDFATLPEPDDNWTEYGYAQRNIKTESSYKVGDVLDYSSKVIRTGTDTEGFMYGINESDPLNPVLIDSSCYDYKDGVVTLRGLATSDGVAVDSVYMAFTNTMFTETVLKTQTFKIKSEAEYGQPNKMLEFSSAAYSGNTVSFNVGLFGASAVLPKEFYVDFGDGTLTTCKATTSDATENNVKGVSTGSGIIKLYVPEGTEVSALAIKDLTLYRIDLSELRSMHTLSLVNTQLYSIDLQWNRSLVNLTLNGNHFSSFSLASNDNQSYAKNALINVDLSNNAMSSFTWNENFTVEDLNLSHNSLSSLTLSKNTKIKKIDVSYNSFDYFNASECSSLEDLNVSHNLLSEITLPEESVLEKLQINDNSFTLATLPEHGDLKEANYIYAPQADYSIPTKGPGVNLSAQALEGKTTYTWKKASGEKLVEGTDYTNKEGRFDFINTEAGKVYCEMTNTDFPAFTGSNVYKTTQIQTAGMPQYVIADFVTANDNEEVTLTMTSLTTGNSVFVDWAGDNDLTQCELATSYKNFNATTKAGAHVKVYSYDEKNNVSVFSLRNATLTSMNAAPLTQLICFNLTNAGLDADHLTLPNAENISEMILPGNNLTSFDFEKYSKVTYLNLASNNFTSFTLPDNSRVQQLFLSQNDLSSVNLGKNSSLWSLYLDGNNLSSIDFSGTPNITQVTLADNLFSEIDLTPIKRLSYVSLVGNRFTFKTLPRVYKFSPNNSSVAYYYGNQAELQIQSVDGVVDLSDQAYVDQDAETNVATEFTWIIGEPDYDDYDELVNEVLVPEGNEDGEDPEYSVKDGVCTFFTAQNQICCVLTNSVFENLTLLTNLINTVSAGVTDAQVDHSAYIRVIDNAIHVYAQPGQAVNVYDAAGRRVRSAVTTASVTVIDDLTAGVYVVTLPGEAAKALIR
jgi:hypothetical protein